MQFLKVLFLFGLYLFKAQKSGKMTIIHWLKGVATLLFLRNVDWTAYNGTPCVQVIWGYYWRGLKILIIGAMEPGSLEIFDSIKKSELNLLRNRISVW